MGLRPTYRYWFLLAAGWAWLALIVLAAWFQAHGNPWGGLLYAWFAPVCHQIPERSFSWGAAPFAVCHRCFGVYAGFCAGLTVWPQLGRAGAWMLTHSRVFWLFLLLMALDVVLPNQSWDRVATGVLVGFPAALFIWVAAEQFPGGRNLISQPRADGGSTRASVSGPPGAPTSQRSLP